MLILHLKRFGVGQKWNEKLATHITFPVKVLASAGPHASSSLTLVKLL